MKIPITSKQLKARLFVESLDLSRIPEEANFDPMDLVEYEGNPSYRAYEYFGDCITTVDEDEIWDATEMSSFLYMCKVLDINKVIDKLENGDREIPEELLNALNNSDIDDLSEVCCGINENENIMFIYISDLDTHYFFDCR